METINIKIVIADNSKKLDSKRGNIYGLFEKKKDGSYLLTVSSHSVIENIMHEIGHVVHDYLYGEPGDNNLPFAFENAFTLWWQKYHGNDDDIQFEEEI